MQIALLILAVLALAYGAVELTPATPVVGLGAVGIACFLAICARIAQAGEQSHKLLTALGALRPSVSAAQSTPSETPTGSAPAHPYAPSSAMAARIAAAEAARTLGTG